MPILMLLTLLVLTLVQSLDHEKDSYHTLLRAAVIWGVVIVASTEFLSLFKAVDNLHLAIMWGVCLLVGLSWLAWQLRHGKSLPRFQFPRFNSPVDVVLLALTIVLAAGALFVAVKAPVQTYNSLSYHMSRVAHWAQDRSVGIYVTGIERQNMMGAFAEYVVLHTYVLQGGDLFVNLVDWSAYLGCILAVAFIAGRLGTGKRGQLVAAAFAASVPMAIAQASSTMTDIVVAFWTLCVIAEIVAALAFRKDDLADLALPGGRYRLAILTKSTAFASSCPSCSGLGSSSSSPGVCAGRCYRMLPFFALVVALNIFFWLRDTPVLRHAARLARSAGRTRQPDSQPQACCSRTRSVT